MSKTCWNCQTEKEEMVWTMYGDVCSLECFDELCKEILGASMEDFNNLLTKD